MALQHKSSQSELKQLKNNVKIRSTFIVCISLSAIKGKNV
jgi:hypothetical protein